MLLESILYASIACLCQDPGERVEAQGGSARPDRVMASFPLRAMISRPLKVKGPLMGSFLDLGQDQDDICLVGSGSGRQSGVTADQIVELVRSHAVPNDESEVFEIHAEGMSLIMSGTPGEVGAGRAMIRYLEAELARSVRVTATIYEVGVDSRLSSRFAPDELERRARDWKSLWSASSVIRTGETAVLAKERWTRYVGDVDVEVAEKASISDPLSLRLFEGVRVVVEPHATLEDDSLVVFSQFAFGQRRGSIPSVTTGVRGQPSIQVPVSETNNGCMSGRVADGGTLVFASRGAEQSGSNLVLAVTVQFRAAKLARIGKVGLYPVSALLSTSLDQHVEPALHDNAKQIVPLRTKSLAKRPFGSFTRSGLESVLYSALSDRLDGDGVGLNLAGNFVVASGDDSFHKRVRAVLESLEKKSLKTVFVKATTTATKLQISDSSVWGSGAATGSAIPWHQLAFPALLGRPHFAMRGIERGAIVDYNVEIAQSKATSNPVMEAVFSGVFLSLNAHAMSDGIAVDVQIELGHVAPLQRRASEGSQNGDLYLPETSRVSLSHRGRVALDQLQTLGDGPGLVIEDRSVMSTVQTLEFLSR